MIATHNIEKVTFDINHIFLLVDGKEVKVRLDKMKEVYKKRVDEFYKYNDQNNSKRVYNWIYEN